MTERKPPEISFTSWVDQQISEAAKRGAFDDLPGVGQPLPKRPDADGQTWLRDYLRREGVSAEELLPTPLKLRKEIERLADTVQGLRSEQEVREVVAGINRRILEWRRIPDGPPVFLPLVKADAMVSRWRDTQPAPSSGPPQARTDDMSGQAASSFPRRRWWHRLSRPLSRPARPAGRPGRSSAR
jgi:hypothetical protein